MNGILCLIPYQNQKGKTRIFSIFMLYATVSLGVTVTIVSLLVIIGILNFARLKRLLSATSVLVLSTIFIGAIANEAYGHTTDEAHGHITNVALKKSCYRPAFAATKKKEHPEYVVDGKLSTSWWSARPDVGASGSYTLQIDLGGTHEVKTFVIVHLGAKDATRPARHTGKFRIETSRTGMPNDWHTAVTVENNPQDESGNLTLYEITPTLMNFIKLILTNPGKDNIARIYEFQAWGHLVSPNNGITGKVTGADDEGIPKVTISAYLQGEEGEQVVSSVMTSANGTYWLYGLPEGTYNLKTVASGYHTMEVTGVPVAIGGTTWVNLSPLPKTMILIDVFHQLTGMDGLLKLYAEDDSVIQVKQALKPKLLKNDRLLIISSFKDNVSYTQTELQAVKKFVVNGGKLLLAGEPRAWRHYNERSIAQMPLNQVAGIFDIQYLEKYYDANNIKLLNRSPTFRLTTMDIIEVAGIDFCALQAPDSVEILIASADDMPLGILLQYGKGTVIAIGDSNFLADSNVDLNMSRFFNYLIYRLTGELFWREF